MKIEKLHAEMARTYPRLFPDGPLYYEFTHGPGWNNISRKLCADINTLISPHPDLYINVVQVKEKFGELRFYCRLGEDCPETVRIQIRALIDAAREESLKTCETCGKPGSLDTTRSYVTTICPDCFAARALNN